jgi:phosphatidylethanolamine/phosphatidyl-N-methylethanolamine N-methyltransferase
MGSLKWQTCPLSLRWGKCVEINQLDDRSVRKAYARWAPVYDFTFGAVSEWARRQAVKDINETRHGRVLEVGVGTGLSLPRYSGDLEITGIDMSVEMLEKARDRVNSKNLQNVAGIYEMDATNLSFPDGYFDTVVAMYVMPVVPHPHEVMAELNRVCAPGGSVVILNHFYDGHGMRGGLEKVLAKYAGTIGWHSDFATTDVMTEDALKLQNVRVMAPFGLFTMIHFQKEAVAARAGLRIVAAE